MLNHPSTRYASRQADKRFWNNQEKGQGVKVRYDKLPTGNLSEKATLTLEQFVAELKKRIKEKEKLKKQNNDKLLVKQVVNEPKLKPIQKQQKDTPAKKAAPKLVQDVKDNPTSNVNIPLPPHKKEDNQESRVTNPVTDKSQDAKIVTGGSGQGTSKLKPSQLPSINNRHPQTPKTNHLPKIPIAGVPAKVEKIQPQKKKPKFTLPKLSPPVQKENKDKNFDDDFFKSGNAESHGNHHVHQHDHLHAHKAFHKHKSKHDHKHAHSNDHVHNHKHTHNHVHNHIHKHNEQHEHNAEHTHTEKHHHKHLEYIDAGGWKKRNDPNSDDNIYARSDADADKEPIFEPFDDESEQKVGIQERSGHVAVGNDVKNNVKDYLQQYIEFYKSVADADVDIADERNDYGGDHMSVTNKKNTFHDKTFMLDDNDFNQQTTEDFYQPEVEQYNTKILPNYEKHQEDVADLSFDDYMTALSDQFPYIADHDEILNDDYDVEDAGSFLSYKMTAAHDNVPNDDVHERAAAWEPVLQDIQIAFYDLEPDWAPQYDVSLERKFDTDEKNDSNE